MISLAYHKTLEIETTELETDEILPAMEDAFWTENLERRRDGKQEFEDYEILHVCKIVEDPKANYRGRQTFAVIGLKFAVEENLSEILKP